ncbi:velvet factor-domain-containing protein [Trametes polyzona]|nr:velvet factor-domain-containing protein [Trametes polyzona]
MTVLFAQSTSAPSPIPSSDFCDLVSIRFRALRSLGLCNRYRSRLKARMVSFSPSGQRLPSDAHLAPGGLHTGARDILGPTVSPKDRNKLSINFLANEPARADTTPRSKRPSSPLSRRARGVNRPSSSLGRSEDVRVDSHISGDQPRTYRLEIVQHPDRTAEFGTSTLTRLPLAPPLIAQLVLRDSSGRTVIDESELPFLVAQLSLLSGDGSSPMDYTTGGRDQSRGEQGERLLYGNLVSSPHLLRNLQGRRGVYFLYPDVAVRERGRFQLKVTLIRLPRFDDPQTILQGNMEGTILADARSLPFDVYPLRDYVAPAQTPLTQFFLQQGARMIAPPPRCL